MDSVSQSNSEDQRLTAEFRPVPDRTLRFLLGAFAGLLTGIFILAAGLSPDPRGFGTHQKLGLPPCEFRQWSGINCPHCGMTTAFCHLVRGQFDAAWRSNPCSLVLAPLFLISIPWFAWIAVTGRFVWTEEPLKWMFVAAVVHSLLALTAWAVRTF